jgi:hypothetical protein
LAATAVAGEGLAQDRELDPETERMLRSLGYIN